MTAVDSSLDDFVTNVQVWISGQDQWILFLAMIDDICMAIDACLL